MIKIQWLASIWCQNDQSNAKLQTRSNYDEFASIWRPNDQKWWVAWQTIQKTAKLQKWSKYNDFHRFDVKNFKTTQNNESDQITMNLHRFDVQTIKNVELRRKPFKTAKLQKWSKYNDFHRFDVKNFKTTQNCKSNQITMNYIYITSKWSKMLLCRKTIQTTENYKSDQIGRQNEQNDELRRKSFKTTQNYESDQIIMNCIDLTSKRSKMLSYVAKHSKQR